MNQKSIFAALLLALATGPAIAQQGMPAPTIPRDKTKSTPRLNPVIVRADRLSDHMVRQLRLNGYQASRLRAINEDKVAKMAAIERKNAGNPKLIDEECQGVCKERDQELRNVLSNDQYSAYFGARSAYYKYDKDYASQSASILLAESVNNPAPTRANDAVIAPTKEDKPARPAGNLGRNAR
ncbi:hypothetical protein GCM10023185_05900 [Hymenobacter saemangeumensis]|uniref:Uncharacterized protein n=1 Tax=Hymenobacter saemangeumensis TaxID=1084522 RepID=A0ABP8I187_9BACT